MVMEDGEWRIDAAPDALIVPEDWFETRYRQVSLYFFDPTASILAPEPVFVPQRRAARLDADPGPGDGPRRGAAPGRADASSRPASRSPSG